MNDDPKIIHIKNFVFEKFNEQYENPLRMLFVDHIRTDYFKKYDEGLNNLAHATKVEKALGEMVHELLLTREVFQQNPANPGFAQTPLMAKHKTYDDYLNWKWWNEAGEKAQKYVVLVGIVFGIISLWVSIKSCSNSAISEEVKKDNDRIHTQLDSVENIMNKHIINSDNQSSNSATQRDSSQNYKRMNYNNPFPDSTK